MPTRLSADEMLAKVDEHGAFEAVHDWAGAFETLNGGAVYLYYPWRLRCAGREAITEAWIRTFSFPFFDPSRSGGSGTVQLYVNDDSVLRIRTFAFTDDAGRVHPSTLVTQWGF